MKGCVLARALSFFFLFCFLSPEPEAGTGSHHILPLRTGSGRVPRDQGRSPRRGEFPYVTVRLAAPSLITIRANDRARRNTKTPQREFGDRSYKAMWRRYRSRVLIACSAQLFAQFVSSGRSNLAVEKANGIVDARSSEDCRTESTCTSYLSASFEGPRHPRSFN